MDVARQSYWQDSSGKINSEKKILEILSSSSHTTFILDGISGCGKTRILKRLKQNCNDDMCILSYEEFVDLMIAFIKKDLHSIPDRMADTLSCFRMIAIEDLDFLYGRSNTLELIMATIDDLSKNRVCIISGNYLDTLTPEIYTLKDIHYFSVCR